MIAIVVAADQRGAIGVENKIPWRIKSDLVRLSNLTRGHPVVLGRKSYDSMVWYYNRSGRPMPSSCYVVVTRNKLYRPARTNDRVAHSVSDALAVAKSLRDDNIFVIGGGGIFKEALPETDRIHFTQVDTTITGDIDAYFPPIDKTEWHEVQREHHEQSDTDQFATDYIIFDRTA